MSVGIVVVSHSAQLARGVVELAEQMTQNKTPLAAAGGAEQDILGTSVEKILNAIQQVDSPDGVLVLLDLGSAILSTEMALEILEPEQQAHVRLSHAPLVEGTLNAALEASLGHSLAQVQQAAELTTSDERLRQFKPISQPVGTTLMEPWTIDRGSEPPTPVGTTLMAPEETRSVKASKDVRGVKEEQPEQEVQLTLINPAGLHARPASLFVQTAARFQARVQVSLHGQAANATSIMNVLGLNARQSDTITLSASGPEAEAALTALSELVRAAFHETSEATPAASTAPPPATPPHPPATPPAQETSGTLWRGVVVSPGIAVGAAYLYHSSNLDIQHRSIDEQQVPDEQQRLRTSVEQTIRTLANLSKRVRESIGQDEAGIFEAQALMLQDPTLLDTALDLIAEQRIDAASALSKAGEQQAKLLEELDNELLAARATDVRDVVSRAVRALRGQEQADPAALRQPAILIARDLAPSDTAQLRPELVLGICTSQGGPTAHTAILARSLGIPAIAGLDETALARIRSGDELALDADNGLLYHQPAETIRQQLLRRLVEQQQRRAARQSSSFQASRRPLVIASQPVHLFANIASTADARAARQWGATGIGLLRTEFLFAAGTTLPGEKEQRRSYASVFRAFQGDGQSGPIVVRTLDAGADKPMPALEAVLGSAKETNPALGLRGIRIHLQHQQLLEQQLRALLLAAADTGIQLHIMFPMISTVEELRDARAIFERVHARAHEQVPAVPDHVPLGIMMEVPAAAFMATELAAEADFFSIGTNDFSQYTLACDRTNTAVSYLYHPMQPAVLRAIHAITQAGCAAGKPVAVCGEMAGDPRIAPILICLGVNELSMAPTTLPEVRAALEPLASKSEQEVATLADAILRLRTVNEVEQFINHNFSQQSH